MLRYVGPRMYIQYTRRGVARTPIYHPFRIAEQVYSASQISKPRERLTFQRAPRRLSDSLSASVALGKRCPYTMVFKSHSQSFRVTSETNHGYRLPWNLTCFARPLWMRKSATSPSISGSCWRRVVPTLTINTITI